MRNILLTGLLTLLLAASAMAQLPGGITILPATADGSTGTFGFRELRTNGTNATGFRAPTSLAADVYYTLPSADGSSGECLSTNGSGTLSWASCSGGGSSYYQTVRTFGGVDLTQRSVLRIASPAISVYDDAGGAETEMTLATSPAIAAVLVGTGRTLTTTTPLTIAGTTSADLSADRTLACPTCVTTNTAQTITGIKTHTASLNIQGGSTELIFKDGTGSLTSHKIGYQGANITDVRNSSGGSVLSFRSDSSPAFLLASAHIAPSSDNTYDLGTASLEFRNGYFDGTLTTDALTIGAAAAGFTTGTWSGATVMQTDALAISTSGSFYIRTYTGADVNCTSVSDGWIGYRLDTNELQICDGGAMVAK